MKLRVAYAGYDFFSSCLGHLLGRDDFEVVLCLTGKPQETVSNVQRLCVQNHVPIHFGPWNDRTMALVNQAELDVLVAAAYSYRVPIEHLTVRRAINVHPSILPDGRGPNPLPRLVDSDRNACGLSIHEMTSAFDAGAVLLQHPIMLDERDGFDQLALKMFGTAPIVLGKVLDDLDELWESRRPQNEGSYWPLYQDEDRTVRATSDDIARAMDIVRRFGAIGIIVETADGSRFESYSTTTARCIHGFPLGETVALGRDYRTLTLPDGLLRLQSPNTL